MSRSAGPVLVFTPHPGVGDLMWHLPIIRSIARTAPGGQVVLAARPSSRARDLLACEPSISSIEYLTYHSGALKRVAEVRDFHRLCRRLRPSAVWVPDKIARPIFAAWLAGAPVRRGFGLGYHQELWLTPGPRLPAAMREHHHLDKLPAFEAAQGFDASDREPGLVVCEDQRQAILKRFADAPRPWTVLGIGASHVVKRWPLERFAELAAEVEGTVFWLGGPDDTAAVEAVMPPGSVNVSDLKLDAGAALIAESDLFVGNDSGPMNVAASVGCTTLGLFGPTPVLTFSKWLHAVAEPSRDLRNLETGPVLEALRKLSPKAVARSAGFV